MILSDFKLRKVLGRNVLDTTRFATVVVTIKTGHLWWRREIIQVREIFRRDAWIYWRFLDTGEYCPGHQAEILEAAYNARQALLEAGD